MSTDMPMDILWLQLLPVLENFFLLFTPFYLDSGSESLYHWG